MKSKLLFSILITLLMCSVSYASFPVKRTIETTSNVEVSDSTTEVIQPLAAPYAGKDLTVGILLWFFLGGLAGHRWYYGKPVGWNILFILTAGGFLIWWVIDLVNMINGDF
ncbi:TM2 domain-containing protein [Seonamhaeicola maritimus]|uniref:TM2 domain-containing protein n=1 Tax=Seonamhaeicola maritimus TaxID=2591822 RepID=UPI002493E2C5|nr:TM2 domain-containing protein [Seonamhaeicola maritimus]